MKKGDLQMDEMNNSRAEKEIDLRVLWGIIRKNLIPIILVTVLFAGAFYTYSKFFIKKQYEAVLIKSDAILGPVIENLDLNTTAESLQKSINVTSMNSTQVIRITMRSTNASYAKEVIAEIVKVAPPIIKDTVEAGSVKVVSDATISNNGAAVSPDSRRNGIIGALVGLVLILAFVFIREFTNNTFKTEDDVLNSLGIPLLGIIPSVDTKDFNKNV